ncbi:MAG TPA: hypothetical protein VIJ51_01130 [Solirubrobacteraceae bacterium]
MRPRRSPPPIPGLRRLLAASPTDPGCEAGYGLLEHLVELELAGRDPGTVFPAAAIHLQNCPACRADYEGLRASATPTPIAVIQAVSGRPRRH